MVIFKIMFSFQALEFVFIGSKSVWSYFSHACDCILKTDNQAVHQEPLSPKGKLKTCCCWVEFAMDQQGEDDWAGTRVREANTLMVWVWWVVLPQVRWFCCCLSATMGQNSLGDWPGIQTLHRQPQRDLVPQSCKRRGLQMNKNFLPCGEAHSSQSTFRNMFSCLQNATKTWVSAEVAEYGVSCSIATDHPASLSGQSGQA